MGHHAKALLRLAVAAAIGLAGCAVSDPTQYYALGGAGSAESRANASAAPRINGVGIGVGPVIMPAYLDRLQIVTRSPADQLELLTFHRWAEPLADGISRILTEEIGAGVPTERIVSFPWRGALARDIQYQVVVAVVRFDGRPGGDVTLDARWRILRRDGQELALQRSTVTETAPKGPGIGPLVAAMTRTLVTLGQDIAAVIRTMPSSSAR